MKLKIKSVILIPKDTNKTYRVVPFAPDKVNVITGESHKGKSALVHIIDYCLGSEKCSIPVGTIREKTEWFGLHLTTDKTELMLFRREPGNQISTSEMLMYEQGKEISIDEALAKNPKANRDAVVNRLNQLAGLSTERFDTENLKNQFGSAASFRDTSAFQFQPQHIVANPYALFYKADTYEHQQKLKTTFPLFIGAINNEALMLEKEIKSLENSLKNLQNQLLAKKRAVDAWLTNLKALYARSVQLALVSDVADNNEFLDTEQYLERLQQIVNDFKENPIPLYQSGAGESDVNAQKKLEDDERGLQNDIGTRKIRLLKLQNLNTATSQYKSTVNVQQKRLEPVGWFKKKLTDEYCPFCESKNETAKKQIEALHVYNQNLETVSNAINTPDVNLDKEISEVKEEIRSYESRLSDVREIMRDLYRKSADENQKRQSIEEIYRFVGRLEQQLENVEATDIDSSLDNDIKSLEAQLDEKRQSLREIKSQNNQQNILRKIAGLISTYVAMLDIDRPTDPVELDINNLTLKILSSTSNRSDFLWEVGSGANWMGYHLSTLFALHEYFSSLKQNAVPSFLFIDQPSQVYFPKDIPKVNKNIKTFDEYKSQSGDLTQTRKIFNAASQCVARSKGKVQIIIVEHAPEITWQGIDNIHLVDEWIGDKALIPKEWL